MPTKVIFTRPSTDVISISLDLNGLKGNTRILLSDALIADIDNDFSDRIIGSNTELKSKRVEMTTSILRLLGHENAEITYRLSGAAIPYSQTFIIPFDPTSGIATHKMTFIFR